MTTSERPERQREVIAKAKPAVVLVCVVATLAVTVGTVLDAQRTQEIGRAHSELQSQAYRVCRHLLEKKKAQ